MSNSNKCDDDERRSNLPLCLRQESQDVRQLWTVYTAKRVYCLRRIVAVRLFAPRNTLSCLLTYL